MIEITIIFFILLIISLINLFITKYKHKQTLLKLDNMIMLALNDEFNENIYDESLLSSIEIKFHQFLLKSLEQHNKLENEHIKINRLISDISHQTKTPLSNIIIYSELLKEQSLTLEANLYINELETQTTKLNFLIESMIKASRLENGIIKPIASKNEFNHLIKNIISSTRQEALKKNIKINTVSSLESGNFDLKWTTEAVFNILDNAIKYSYENSEININITSFEFFSCIEIHDRGLGIPEDEIPKIFKRFYRSKNVLDKSGVGIGLYLAREIILAQNGYIKVKSDKQGTIFSIFIPK